MIPITHNKKIAEFTVTWQNKRKKKTPFQITFFVHINMYFTA